MWRGLRTSVGHLKNTRLQRVVPMKYWLRPPVGNIGSFWSVLVTDTGDAAGDTVEEVGCWWGGCSGASAFKLSGSDEFMQMTGMGEWWGNDYFLQPIVQQADALEERALMRLDLLDVGEHDVLYAICPDGRIAPDFSYRVDTSIFQTLAVERGWVAQWLETTQTLPPIVYKTPVHAPVYKGSGAQAIYKKYGLGKAVGRRKPSTAPRDGATALGFEEGEGDTAGKAKDFTTASGKQPTPEATKEKAAPSAAKTDGGAAAVKPPVKSGPPDANKGKTSSAPTQKPELGASQSLPRRRVLWRRRQRRTSTTESKRTPLSGREGGLAVPGGHVGGVGP
ncbi:hypothetical protein ACJJTC_010919 [Scirpophaga incertulas]